MTGEARTETGFNDHPAFDERLVSRAVVEAALEVSEDDLALDREDPRGTWRIRRVAHSIARRIGKEEGFGSFEGLVFIGNVRKAASNLRLVDEVRSSQDV